MSSKFRHKRVDIYIEERSGGQEIRVPWLPEKIDYESGGAIVATYDIMNKGPVAVPTGSGLATVSWTSVFPGRNRRNDDSMRRGSWKDPSKYHKILEKWKKNGTRLSVMVTGFPINLDVQLTDYTAHPSGGFGDVEYSVKFTEDRDIKITATVLPVNTDQSAEQKRPAEQTTDYTIKSGDNLWKIAQQFLGSGSKNTEIYAANAEIIEATAKKYGKSSSNNGWWIYPGVTIKIPTTGTSSSQSSGSSSAKSTGEETTQTTTDPWAQYGL